LAAAQALLVRLLSQAASAVLSQKMPTSSTAIIRISLTSAGVAEDKPLQMLGGHPQGQVVSVAQIVML
jgi:hypothetical protein